MDMHTSGHWSGVVVVDGQSSIRELISEAIQR